MAATEFRSITEPVSEAALVVECRIDGESVSAEGDATILGAAATLANESETAKTRSKIELIIVIELFKNEAGEKFGHIFLPAASSTEKDGTFINAERLVQPVRKRVDPPGTVRVVWEIICDLAKHIGHKESFTYASPEATGDA